LQHSLPSPPLYLSIHQDEGLNSSLLPPWLCCSHRRRCKAFPSHETLYTNPTQSVDLASLGTFGVLSGSAGVTNVGATAISGDLGTSGVSITGFPPGTITGTENIGDSKANTAYNDGSLAYAAAKGQASTADMSTQSDLTGMTLYPGVYTFATTASLTGQLFLSGNSTNSTDANATAPSFTFQIGTALLINGGSQIILEDGASACNIVWQVGSSATLSVGIEFVGNILAYSAINVKTDATVDGVLFAQFASITLEDNAITVPSCS